MGSVQKGLVSFCIFGWYGLLMDDVSFKLLVGEIPFELHFGHISTSFSTSFELHFGHILTSFSTSFEIQWSNPNMESAVGSFPAAGPEASAYLLISICIYTYNYNTYIYIYIFYSYIIILYVIV